MWLHREANLQPCFPYLKIESVNIMEYKNNSASPNKTIPYQGWKNVSDTTRVIKPTQFPMHNTDTPFTIESRFKNTPALFISGILWGAGAMQLALFIERLF